MRDTRKQAGPGRRTALEASQAQQPRGHVHRGARQQRRARHRPVTRGDQVEQALAYGLLTNRPSLEHTHTGRNTIYNVYMFRLQAQPAEKAAGGGGRRPAGGGRGQAAAGGNGAGRQPAEKELAGARKK